jgi:2-phospho-L-lactate guanylyltransferase
LTRIVAIPVKPFGVAKRRLSGVLTAEQRQALSVELARRTANAAIAAGAAPLILSADEVVSEWAASEGYDVLLDEGSSLDEAAHAATLFANNEPWVICHADLPLLRSEDLARAVGLMMHGSWVLAPSNDGGTSLIGGVGQFDFAFGPASFHRHLARLANRSVHVMASLGTLLDLDLPGDFVAASAHPRGAWLNSVAPIRSDR